MCVFRKNGVPERLSKQRTMDIAEPLLWPGSFDQLPAAAGQSSGRGSVSGHSKRSWLLKPRSVAAGSHTFLELTHGYGGEEQERYPGQLPASFLSVHSHCAVCVCSVCLCVAKVCLGMARGPEPREETQAHGPVRWCRSWTPWRPPFLLSAMSCCMHCLQPNLGFYCFHCHP